MATYDLEQQEQLDQVKHFWKQYGNLITWVLVLASLLGRSRPAPAISTPVPAVSVPEVVSTRTAASVLAMLPDWVS